MVVSLRISSSRFPVGVTTVTVSPFFLPIRLRPMGEVVEINAALATHTKDIEGLENDFEEFARAKADKLAPGMDWTKPEPDELRKAGEKLYKDLQHAGLDVLLDDRDERAGVKFKDADLIGVPYRITLGKKVADGLVELFDRRTKTTEDVKLSEIVSRVQTLALAGL